MTAAGSAPPCLSCARALRLRIVRDAEQGHWRQPPLRPQLQAGLVVWMVLSVAEQLRHISTLVFRRVPGSLGNGISYYGFFLSVGGVSVPAVKPLALG
jgi:hypothetical protein